MYIRPVDFEVEPGKWEAMSYIFAADNKTGTQCFSAVGLAFSDAEYAIKFFRFLKSWNGGQKEILAGRTCRLRN